DDVLGEAQQHEEREQDLVPALLVALDGEAHALAQEVGIAAGYCQGGDQPERADPGDIDPGFGPVDRAGGDGQKGGRDREPDEGLDHQPLNGAPDVRHVGSFLIMSDKNALRLLLGAHITPRARKYGDQATACCQTAIFREFSRIATANAYNPKPTRLLI